MSCNNELSNKSNEKIRNFAQKLTGSNFYVNDIITAERNIKLNYPSNTSYPQEFFIDLANDE